MKEVKIMLVDDHTLVRQSWSFFLNLEANFEVIAETGSGTDAVQLAKKFKPHIIIMDINLNDINGIEATSLIMKECPDIKIIAVSMHQQMIYARKMINAGAKGYLTKTSLQSEMTMAINEVLAGRRYICSEMAEKLIDDSFDQNNKKALSERELQIIDYIKLGLSSTEIASSLSLSPRTIEHHRSQILKKLKQKNTVTLINFLNEQSTSLF